MKNFLNISDFSSADLREIIDQAMQRKKNRDGFNKSSPDKDEPLKGKTMIMIFDLLSTILRDVDTETGKKLGDPSFLATSSQEQVRLIPKSIKNDVYHY